MPKTQISMESDPSSERCGWLVRLSALEGDSGFDRRPGDREMAFHISRWARDRYQFDDELFNISGNVILPNFHAVRTFTQTMNTRRNVLHFPEKAIRAGQLNAMGLIDEILHYVVGMYREQVNKTVMAEALSWLERDLGPGRLTATLQRFVQEFPPLPVYRGEVTVDQYLDGSTGTVAHREMALEEMLLLWLANVNPAFGPFRELFDDRALETQTAYLQVTASLHRFFSTQPEYGPDRQNLLDMLRSPAIAVPHFLTGQLNWIREKWGLLVRNFIIKMLTGLDLVKEEEKIGFGGPGQTPVYRFDLQGAEGGQTAETERFSPDLDWMPRLVLIAKCTYVWLDQLSRKYGRVLTTLDQIPDEELDLLSRWGFTGLWLIGVWERSRSSRRIKQLCGNPEALASAYSLFDYVIAEDLGGEAALDNLRQRAWRRGIRLAADMVPNHMGIDSPWVMNHPDWFLQLDQSPYPAYSFNGPNLSWDDRVGLRLEDHYYDRTDAAVVFQWTDTRSGHARYIYHGNDGTRMPWNDTAQLNYLRPEVREAAIQAILNVARRFPVIRFDAAMTLTKRHYQRLWFPEPGAGGDIPTRAGRGLSKPDFDREMPEEFWREVVDRVAREAPDTLLLAEAFWLMEGYFVRTLGMHRVYNSAFMNFLKNEDNDKFRTSIRNVMEFNPEIIKRFVNFLNNPDEETAVGQFGKGDKYTGVCVLMATMPGLPMFGHGQIEGYSEKYGMEYRRAYQDEQPDEGLIAHHERVVFPLLRKRYLFAEVANFLLYDLYTPQGSVNENVLAYSNRHGDERALVVYHNKFENASGWIRTAAAYSAADGAAGERRLVQKSLGEGLGLSGDERRFLIFRDHVTGLEYIRNSREICQNGLYLELGAYKCQVFLDLREVEDGEQRQYANLAAFLEGRGVPGIDGALQELVLQPVQRRFETAVNAWVFQTMQAARTGAAPVPDDLLDDLAGRCRELLREICQFRGSRTDPAGVADLIRCELTVWLQLPRLLDDLAGMAGPPAAPDDASTMDRPGDAAADPRGPNRPGGTSLLGVWRERYAADDRWWHSVLAWVLVHRLGQVLAEDFPEVSRSLVDEFRLGRILARAFMDLGMSETDAWRRVSLVRILSGHAARGQGEHAGSAALRKLLERFFQDGEVAGFLQVNRWQDALWYNQECFEELLGYLLAAATIRITAEGEPGAASRELNLAEYRRLAEQLATVARTGQYQVRRTLDEAARLAEPEAAEGDAL